MTVADHIHFNDDGTAWWVVRKCPEPRGQQSMHTDCNVGATILDQPCDTCGGEGVVDDLDNDGAVVTCEWCDGTGRHTFTVEVECRSAYHEPTARRVHGECHYCKYGIRTHHVSVVPGMVLPITEDTDVVPKHDPHIIQFDGRCGGEPFVEFVPCNGRGLTDDPIALPPAARPGMWAVKLEVHP
jgi:hypothetical protein